MADGQVRTLQGALRDVESCLFVLCDALLELGGTQAIEGVAAYMQRKLGAVHAALLRAQQQEKPQTQLLQPGTASPAGAPPRPIRGAWLPWIDGVCLQANGQLEEAAAALRPLLSSGVSARGRAGAGSFVACHVSACYADLGAFDDCRVARPARRCRRRPTSDLVAQRPGPTAAAVCAAAERDSVPCARVAPPARLPPSARWRLSRAAPRPAFACGHRGRGWAVRLRASSGWLVYRADARRRVRRAGDTLPMAVARTASGL